MAAHPKKIENVLALGPEARRDYFVRKVADSEVVWGLRDSGWATGEVAGHTVVPFWPEAEFAVLCAKEEWDGFKPEPIPLGDFISRWLTGMALDARLCVIFPTPAGKGVNMDPGSLRQMIDDELKQYE
ncbi:DUF2750 domain-containing protein [Burkholderia gladioli]|uniref:DUF2750 domain-containing protein n=1 Tax=Burkholderia gladioli TaxID=28095 RepID=UPI00163EEF03|nr:DUF2750 domain-containing protein [Burkholderia gladioli]